MEGLASAPSPPLASPLPPPCVSLADFSRALLVTQTELAARAQRASSTPRHLSSSPLLAAACALRMEEDLVYAAPRDQIERALQRLVAEERQNQQSYRAGKKETHTSTTYKGDEDAPDPVARQAFIASAQVPEEKALLAQERAVPLAALAHARQIAVSKETRVKEVNYLPKRALVPRHLTPPPSALRSEEGARFIVTVSLFSRDPRRARLREQSFRFLDTHTLADVVERFYCLHDYDLAHEREVHLPQEPPRTMGAFVLLEDTLYRYDRHGATDIASELAAWLADPKRGAAQRTLEVKDMSATPLHTLHVTLGRRYVYRHAGDCDHALCFDEVRALMPEHEETHHPDDYPQHIFQARALRKKCVVCALRVATHITLDDLLAPAHPAYLCAYCFSQLHPQHRAALPPAALEEIRPLYAPAPRSVASALPRANTALDAASAHVDTSTGRGEQEAAVQALGQSDFFVARYWHET